MRPSSRSPSSTALTREVAALEVAAQLQIVGRIGKDKIDALRR
jgi:hypothetical protein